MHWNDPAGHALVQVAPAPSGGDAAIVVTGVPWRTGWRYRERRYRHIYWDAGTMPAQTLALAHSAGIPALRVALRVALRGIDLPHFVAVHDVDGVPPGVSLDQGLSRDAAFVVFTAAEVASLDDRGYRAAQLAAGLVEGRLHLLAYAMGASATGMTLLGGEIPALVGTPPDAIIFTCVGVPDYRATPGGPPGAPADVRPMQHRD